MKNIFSKKIIIMLLVICIMISNSVIFANTSNNDWSGLGTIAFVVIFVIVIRNFFRLIFKFSTSKRINKINNHLNNNLNNNEFSNNIINNIVSNPSNIFSNNFENVSKEVAQMVKNEDSTFIEEEFLKYACEEFKKFREKIPINKFQKLDEYESKVLNENFEKFNEQFSNDIVNITKAYLLEYKVENEKEILIAGIEVENENNNFGNNNTQYRLIFTRKYTSQNNEYLTITCPYCGAPNQTLLQGICKYCRGNLKNKNEKEKWVLNKVSGINSVRIENNFHEGFNSFFN